MSNKVAKISNPIFENLQLVLANQCIILEALSVVMSNLVGDIERTHLLQKAAKNTKDLVEKRVDNV